MLQNLIPSRWRRGYGADDSDKPGVYDRRITPFLQTVSLKACTHPVRTIAVVAILGSLFYVQLLETGFFQPKPLDNANRIDFATLSSGSRRLNLGPETAWKWQADDYKSKASAKEDLALVTLEFVNSAARSFNVSPIVEQIPTTSHIQRLPSSESVFSPLGSDTTLAFSMPYSETPEFFQSIREIGAKPRTPSSEEELEADSEDQQEQKLWLMKSSRANNGSSTWLGWARNSWTAFVDVLKNAETLDIIIMALGYISLHLTFVSLFMSMRRMGSNFWLAASVLFSSTLGFLFGLIVTLYLGVPENVILISEGVPFLVVTVGFEKPIMLTQAVLSAALRAKNGKPGDNASGDATLTIQNAVQVAVRERGLEIVRDYCIEIAILCAGAASGIQGGLRPFCILAAWTLFFDCILLFTFYTSILTIKLEINRIKRHVAVRKALEEDGVSRRVAENVAASNDWPNGKNVESNELLSLFGRKARDSSIPRFKVLMVSGFLLINVLNLCTMPFRGTRHNSPLPTAGLSSVVTQPPLDPFKVAGNALDIIFARAEHNRVPTTVTVFSPIKYEFQYPSVHYSAPANVDWALFDGDLERGLFSAVGGKVVESLLKSFEDPVLSKWVITALVMSLVLNGYLFNAARWSIKEPRQEQAQQPTHEATNGHAVPPVAQPVRDDEEDEEEEETSAANGAVVKRSAAECEALLAEKQVTLLNDEELIDLALRGKIPGYALEKTLGDKTRAVKIRRALVSRSVPIASKLERSLLPYKRYDYDRVFGACCENVVGYLPLPLGLAGPMTIDGKSYYLPMATTEGVLVASTSRGCKAINAGGGATTVVTADGMTRGPCVGFETLARAAAAKLWLDSTEGQKTMKEAFNSTSRFARLQTMKTAIAGTYLYIRFKTTTGDAMGMNMISKGVEHALRVMRENAGFDDMAIISVSGNFCTDKKPAAINWIDGRGKSVVAEAIIPAEVVRSVLKSDVDALVELNIAKNFMGSAMAGSIGGFNAHAANTLTAMFLATGQDPAQNVESSNCITVMKK
jgi:hydroxymethylglutaryl-CoA reductase (NADPH)